MWWKNIQDEEYPELAAFLTEYYQIPEEECKETRYYYNYTDLNEDGTDEIVAVTIGDTTSDNRHEHGPVKRFSKSDSELYFITFHNTNLQNKKKPVTKNAYVTADSSTRPRIVFANNYSILPS